MTRLITLAVTVALLFPSALSAQLRNRAKEAGTDLSRAPGGANYGKATAVAPDAKGFFTVEWREPNGELKREYGKFIALKGNKALFKLIQRGEQEIPITRLSPAVRKYVEAEAKEAKKKPPVVINSLGREDKP